MRYADVTSEMYQTLYAYMIRLKSDDLTDPAQIRVLAAAGQLSETEFATRFGPVARPRLESGGDQRRAGAAAGRFVALAT